MKTIPFPLACVLALTVSLAACGGGDGDDAPPAPQPEAEHQIEAFNLSAHPHAVQAYRPKGATRAIVFLHGGGGTQHAIAYQMGLKTTLEAAPTMDTVNWSALASAGVIAVFPQGQAVTGNARTWRNHTMDSGQDDMAFLASLAAELRRRYGITQVALAGHSMGGAMVQRVWCEAPTTFQSYVSFAGPASARYLNTQTPCSLGGRAPYLGMFGDEDTVITGAWEAQTWLVSPAVVALQPAGFVNPLMAGEWQNFQTRTQAMCGEAPGARTVEGRADRWQACGGRLQVALGKGAGHDIASISAALGRPAFDLVATFTAPR